MEMQRPIATTARLEDRALSAANDRQEVSTNVKSRTSDTKSSLSGLIVTRRSVLLGLASALIGSSLPMVETHAKRKHRSHKGKRRSSSKKSGFVQLDPNRQLPKLDPNVRTADPCVAAEAALIGFFPQTMTIVKTGNYWAKMTVAQDVSDRYCFIPDGEYQISFIDVTIRQAYKVLFSTWTSIEPPLIGRIRVRFAVDKPSPNTYKFSEAEVLSVEIAQLPTSLQGPVRTAMTAMFPDSFTFTV
jgi:hypothetical protein